MILRQHLATKSNDIPLSAPTFATEHTERGGVVTHIGWKVKARYAGPDLKKREHEYELIFTPEEARLFRARLDDMLLRFDDAFVRDTLARREAEVVTDDAE